MLELLLDSGAPTSVWTLDTLATFSSQNKTSLKIRTKMRYRKDLINAFRRHLINVKRNHQPESQTVTEGSSGDASTYEKTKCRC